MYTRDPGQLPTGLQIAVFGHALAGLLWAVVAVQLFGLSSDLARLGSLAAPMGINLPPGMVDEVLRRPAIAALLALGLTAGYFAAAWGLWNLRWWAPRAVYVMAGLAAVVPVIWLYWALSIVPGVFSLVFNWALGHYTLQILAYVAATGAAIYYLLKPEVAALFPVSMEQGGFPCPHCGYQGLRYDMRRCPKCGASIGAEPPPPPPPPPNHTQLGPRTQAAEAWLVVRVGPDAGKRFDLDADARIGREPGCQVRLKDDFVSRLHARVMKEDGCYFIHPASDKDTFVNDHRVSERRLLADGTMIRLGQTTMEFKQTARIREQARA